ncbi:MAG: WG repeat-containing protein [Hominimerdicola sp.]
MKNINLLLIVTIIVFDLLAAYKVVTYPYHADEDKYKIAVQTAEDYSKENLCKKAVDAYQEVLSIKDTYEVRMKMIDLYDKGYENKEFSNLSFKYDCLIDTINKYPSEAKPYEIIIDMYYSDKDFDSCADYILLSQKNNIESDFINKAYKIVCHMYEEYITDFESVKSLYNNFYLASKSVTVSSMQSTELDNSSVENEAAESNYCIINDHGSIAKTVTASCMSPTSGGWAFYKVYGRTLKQMGSGILESLNEEQDIEDGQLYAFVEDENGVRQFYLDSVLSSETGYGDDLLCCYNEKTKTYTYYDKTGKELYKGFSYAGRFNDTVAVTVQNQKTSIIKTDGTAALEDIDSVILNEIEECSFNGKMFVKYKGENKYSLVNTSDLQKVGDFTCDNADLFIDGLAAFEKDGKWGFVNSEGKVVIQPEYENAKSFSNGLAAVQKNGSWGFINESGEMMIDPIFSDAKYFTSKGVCFVQTEGEIWQIIRLYYWDDNDV